MVGYETYEHKQLVEDDAYFLIPAQAFAELEGDNEGRCIFTRRRRI